MQLAFKNIVVATDFDDAAQLALEYARVIANRFGAGIRVLHVVEMPVLTGTELDVPDVTVSHQRMLEEAQRRLAETLLRVSAGDIIGQVLVGHAAEKIVEYASDHNADLIVMGTHGRRALAHFIMGSVAERVVRTAPCPVFTVRDAEAVRRAGPADRYAAAS
jgi:nucleotide-binding universal stress UspA family protein